MDCYKKVSIIIPVYNVSSYLNEAVSSACNQTYRNLEIILVDDGSTDSSPKICDKWAQRDHRIKVIHKENGGLSDARNTGLDAATGDYICFLDGDDFFSPDLVDTASLFMELGNDLVVFQHYNVKQDGIIEDCVSNIGEYEFDGVEKKQKFYLQILLKYGIGWEAWSRMYRRDIIERQHLRFADNRRIFAEDLYFNICYCLDIARLQSIGDKLYYYRFRDGSIMNKQARNINAGRMNELSKEVYDYFLQHKAPDEIMQVFPAMHYLILLNCIQNFKKANGIDGIRIRRYIQEDIQDWSYFSEMLGRMERTNEWRRYFSRPEAVHMRKVANYWRTGNIPMFALKTAKVNYLSGEQELKRIIAVKTVKKHKRKVFYLGSETFGNLGDGMIAETIMAFCSKFLAGVPIEEIPLIQYWIKKPYLLSAIQPDDLIIMTGGGNFGNQYIFAQKVKEDITKTWPKNRKVVFPQTIYYVNNKEQCLEKDEKLFVEENNIIMFAREQASYEFAKNHFSCKIELAPDIVLSRKYKKELKREKHILFIMRSDEERILTSKTVRDFIGFAKEAGLAFKAADLQMIYYGAEITSRKKELSKKMEQFGRARIIVTDRLHGMIIAAITGTPCIAFRNYNHKVDGTYTFINYLPYIKLAYTPEEAGRFLRELLTVGACKYDNSPLSPYFKKLVDSLH